MVGFWYAPRGWARCDGAVLAINQNQALFALLGTTYGGNGVTTFNLPDLRGRAPVHSGVGGGTVLGESAGSETHTLALSEMPVHGHTMMVARDYNNSNDPAGRVLGSVPEGGANPFHAPDGTAALHPASLSGAGGNQPHNNMQPYLTTNFIICTAGVFPSRQ